MVDETPHIVDEIVDALIFDSDELLGAKDLPDRAVLLEVVEESGRVPALFDRVLFRFMLDLVPFLAVMLFGEVRREDYGLASFWRDVTEKYRIDHSRAWNHLLVLE